MSNVDFASWIENAREVIRRDLKREVKIHAIALIGSEVRVLISSVEELGDFTDISLNGSEELKFGPSDREDVDSDWTPEDDMKQITAKTRTEALQIFKAETEHWYDFLQGGAHSQRIGLHIHLIEPGRQKLNGSEYPIPRGTKSDIK